jgi:uncharacterized repeat protein (TIGR03847 family)
MNLIELDGVDALGAGAIGEPGARAFYIQADKRGSRLTVLVEKEQVALLAAEAASFLDRIADDHPEIAEARGLLPLDAAGVSEPAVPLFRARMIGLGFEPDRDVVLIELREHGEDDDEAPDDGYVARIFATRAQVRAMAQRGTEAVEGGRPLCPLCEFPMDPAGHACPRWN